MSAIREVILHVRYKCSIFKLPKNGEESTKEKKKLREKKKRKTTRRKRKGEEQMHDGSLI